MAKPLGMIISQNPVVDANDVYATVLNNVVTNTILASYNFITSIAQDYDYCVDLTMQGDPAVSTGYTYNASLNQFTAPPAPPIDWIQNVRQDFDNIISDIHQVIIDCGKQGGSLNNNNIQAAYNSALNDNQNLDIATTNLLATILQYVLAGG